MPLESLHLLVETLKERIDSHRTALTGSEALTRYALINPLLRELGWDTADPTQVIPEFGSGKGRADYALLGREGKPAMMVEAKPLGASLRDTALTQGITYCIELGTKYFALTDGSRWEVYETFLQVAIDEKRIVEFDLSEQPPAEVCLRALALWRSSVDSGKAQPGRVPLTMPESETTPMPEPPDEESWQSISGLDVKEGDTAPAEICFPDNSRLVTKYWVDIVRETVRWLAVNQHLRASYCPVPQGGVSNWYLVAERPFHPNGEKFSSSEQVENLWIEKRYTAPNQVRNTLTIIKHVGQDPAQFRVRFD